MAKYRGGTYHQEMQVPIILIEISSLRMLWTGKEVYKKYYWHLWFELWHSIARVLKSYYPYFNYVGPGEEGAAGSVYLTFLANLQVSSVFEKHNTKFMQIQICLHLRFS